MFKVAKFYYIDEFIQTRIARRLNISKYKVNRILKKAKEEGIVQIKIIKPENEVKD